MGKRKLVVVYDNAPLTELGYPVLFGPISTPTRLPLDQIQKMVLFGRKVFEANPSDPYNKELYVELTLNNVNSDNFAKKEESNEQDEATQSVPDNENIQKEPEASESIQPNLSDDADIATEEAKIPLKSFDEEKPELVELAEEEKPKAEEIHPEKESQDFRKNNGNKKKKK